VIAKTRLGAPNTQDGCRPAAGSRPHALARIGGGNAYLGIDETGHLYRSPAPYR
jgi:hypothetical protein